MAYQREKVKARQVVTPNTQTQTLGVVANVPMGDWNATTPYQKLNMVRYNGATYIATQANTGIAPTTSSVWQLVNADGKGVQSIAITYQAGILGTVPPTGEWVDSVPEVPQGQYLWTRTVTVYTDNTQTVGYSVSLQGLNFTQEDKDDLTRIEGAIPSTATASNPLATHDFVNSSINAVASYYITPTASGDTAFATHSALVNATTFYNGGKTRIPTQNDYAIVQADETKPQDASGKYPTTRYSYQGGTYPNGSWEFQYIVNNTTLTNAQLNAINSGITNTLVGQIDTNKNAISAEVTNRQNADSTLQTSINKNLYNLGAYDTIVSNGDGTATITRKTGYLYLDGSDDENWKRYLADQQVYFYANVNGFAPYGTFNDNYNAGAQQVNNYGYPLRTPIEFNNGGTTTGVSFGGGVTIGIKSPSFTSLTSLKQGLSQKPLIVQYLLKTEYQYTETIILNQPINTLNQDGEGWLIEEWKKGLNLARTIKPSVTISVGAVIMGYAEVEVGKQYRLTLTGTKTGDGVLEGHGGWLVTTRDDLNIPNSFSAVFVDENTFLRWENLSVNGDELFTATKKYVIVVCGGNGQYTATLTVNNLMLTEGTQDRPYLPYRGKIIRQVDVPIYYSTVNISPASIIGGEWEELGSFTTNLNKTIYAWRRL